MTYSQSYTLLQFPKDKTLVLFDGFCNLCNASVVFILKRDKKEQFYFAPLNSRIANELSEKFPEVKEIDSILVYKAGKIYAQSSAALKISVGLSGLWPLMGVFWVVPKFIRDWLYKIVARNRYRWFGKTASCMVPQADVNHRFLTA